MIRSKSQTLITCVYRTGSEYIAHLINCRPQINVSMYSVNVLRFIWKRYDPISERVNYTAALNDLDSRLKTRYEKSLDMAVIMQTLSEYEIIDYGSLYDVVMTTLYLKPPATHWAEKNQLLWREIPAFLEMMPNGKAILIIRDPRSVLLSFKQYTYAPAPAYLGAVFNCYDSMTRTAHALYLLPE